MLRIEKTRTRVLIVSRSGPDPYHGSTRHMEDFVRYLKQSDCEVHYLALCAPDDVSLARSSVDAAYFPDRNEWSKLDFDAPVAEWERQAVQKVCLEAGPGVVIADYSWMADLFDAPYFKDRRSVRKVIFVHDLRVRIMPSYVLMGLVRAEDNTWTDEKEGKLLSKADALLTLNEDDRQKAQSIAPQVRVLKMGMSVTPQFVDPSAAISGRCIYVASALNENVFSVGWLLKYVWPLVLEANPSASLIVCGSVSDSLKSVMHREKAAVGGLEQFNVFLEGKKDDLGASYASAQIALIPHWMMGGLKIKHIEAIAHGLAVVCTPAGADGLPEAVGHSAMVAAMPPEFAQHIIGLMKNGETLEQVRKNSRNLGLRLTPAAVYREVGDYLREA